MVLLLVEALVDGGNFDWTADPKRQPLFNEPDASYGGVVWGKAVPELTGANVSFAVRARVTIIERSWLSTFS